MKEQKTGVFISYSHKDREDCIQIAALLEKAEGFQVWFDRGLVPGEVYRKRIAEVITGSEYFMVLISSASAASEWVLDEVEYAKKLHKKIIPVWLEDVVLPGDVDMILQRYHSLFWHLRASDAQFEESLMAVLGLNADMHEELPHTGLRNEYSEKDNLRMAELLELEKRGAYAECYSPENACMLGIAYLYGGPCAPDRQKAQHYFRVAEYNSNADGRVFQLEMMVDAKREETWDEPDAEFSRPIIDELHALAEKGSVPAMMYLANMYWYGRMGLEVDIAKSAALYERCARMGNARAQYMMASNYYFGDGVQKDIELAKMYANLAVEQKYYKSWRRWGKFYRDGIAVEQDYQRARECYEKGVQMGDYNCYNKIGDMLYHGWGFPVDHKAAFEFYLQGEKAPVRGQKYSLGKAKEALGRCYELGHGVERDLAMAAEKYLEGYRCGNNDCRAAYIRCSSIIKEA